MLGLPHIRGGHYMNNDSIIHVGINVYTQNKDLLEDAFRDN